MKRTFTLLSALLCLGLHLNAQQVLWTGESTPEAINYHDMVGWTLTDPGLTGKYFNFGTAEAPSFASVVDNPVKAPLNNSDKVIVLKSLQGKSWWPDFFLLGLSAPVTITDANRYLHIMHYRQNLNFGYSMNINKQQTWEDPDKGLKRFDGNLSAAGVWEDIVIDLKWFMDNEEALNEICVLMDMNWGGAAEDPTDYYFDNIVLSASAAPRDGNTYLLTCETTPEPIVYYDFVEWSITEGKIGGWYVDFGDGKFTTIVDNPAQDGINKTAKSLYMDAYASIDWWGNFLNFRLGEPVTITEETRYLHLYHFRENLNDGWSFSLNVNEPLGDGDKGNLRFDGNNSKAGVWEDIVIDLHYLIETGTPLDKMCIIVDKDWNGARDNPPTKYYFDEIVLNADPLQRGVTILEGTDLLSCQSQWQIDQLSLDTQNELNTYEIIDNPFTTSEVNAEGRVLKFSKSDQAAWWQGMMITFPGIHMINYGEKQFLHVMVRADIECNIQLHIIDNTDVHYTEMFVYPKDEIEGDWFDLVWDLSSYMAIKAITVRFDVQVDGEGNFINGTPAGDFYMDEVVLDSNPDQRELISSVGYSLIDNKLSAYSVDKTIYFSHPSAEEVYLFDLSGKMRYSSNLQGGEELQGISVQTSGVYILKVRTSKGKLATAKIYVQ